MHERLKTTRELAGISQRELSRLASVSPSHVHGIESGRITNPTVDTLTKIASTLGVPIDFLLEGKGRHPTKKSVLEAIARSREQSAAAA